MRMDVAVADRTSWLDEGLDRVESTMLELVGSTAECVCAEMARDHLSSGGKRLRARLALEATAALGGDLLAAVPWAAACELLHNASLIHDDWQDGDRTRRGRPALWTTWGGQQAVNAGDLLLMLPTLAVGRLAMSAEIRWTLAACLARHGARTVRGQAYEMYLRGNVHMDRGAYIDAARGKTSGLFGMPVEGAAILTGSSEAEAQQMSAPFERLGLLYQLQDDVIDLFGDKGRQERGADIREGKVSALAVAHVDLHPEERLWLAGVLRTPRERTGAEVVSDVIQRFLTGGALTEVLRWIDELASEVEGPLLTSHPDLQAVARMLLARFLDPLEPVRSLAGRQ